MAKKILVVDDEPDILKLETFRLKKSGYEVATATDGREAFDLIQKEKPDLILLDLRLPIMDGYEVCKRLKADQELKHIPVILLTASTVGKIAGTAKELKADDYLTKPFHLQELLAKVKKFLD